MADPNKIPLGSGLLGRAKKDLKTRQEKIDDKLRRMETGVTKKKKKSKKRKGT